MINETKEQKRKKRIRSENCISFHSLINNLKITLRKSIQINS